MEQKKLHILLVLIILVGAFLRFYKLDWGNGYFFHPDENTVGTAVSQLSFPKKMHPHLYTYGSAPVYLIYFSKLGFDALNNQENHPLLIGRFYSALFSTLAILVFYLIGTKLFSKKWAVLASLLIALSPGLIQQAHFATPEPFLIFLLSVSLLFSLKYLQHSQIKFLLIASIFFGLSLSTKISSLPFGVSILLTLVLTNLKKPVIFFTKGILVLITTALVFAATSPFFFLDFSQYLNTYQYESKLASGQSLIFYTRQFINTPPFIFQLEKIFPYALGPTVAVAGFLGFFLVTYLLLKKFSSQNLLLIISFLSLFLPNIILFVKWTRYMAPTFPFLAILAVFFIAKVPAKLKFSLSLILVLMTFFWSLAYLAIYLYPDSRVMATDWIKENVSANSSFAVESGNVYDLPLEGTFKKDSLFLYDLEDNIATQNHLVQSLEKSDYFIVQSRRVFLNHQRLPQLFPKISSFYQALFSGNLGFEEVKKISSIPRLSYLGVNFEISDEQAEETWTVFDHPVIRIFQKTRQLSPREYLEIINNEK